MRIVSLGDSLSCGDGVGLRVPPEGTWPALLAAATPGAVLHPLATAGARIRDVRRSQLPVALDRSPDVVLLLIGLNDLSRGGFEPEGFERDLEAVVNAVRGSGARLLLARLHDPCAVLPLPRALAAAVRRRVDLVNAVVDRRLGPDVLGLDLAAVPELASRRAWAVDRVHPHPRTHALLAAHAATALRRGGLPLAPVAVQALPERAPGVLRQTWWAARHGLPWLVGRGREVALPAAALALGR